MLNLTKFVYFPEQNQHLCKNSWTFPCIECKEINTNLDIKKRYKPTCVDMTPLVAFYTSNIPHLNTKWLIPNFWVTFTITEKNDSDYIIISLLLLITIVYKFTSFYRRGLCFIMIFCVLNFTLLLGFYYQYNVLE